MTGKIEIAKFSFACNDKFENVNNLECKHLLMNNKIKQNTVVGENRKYEAQISKRKFKCGQ